jgi:L-threonylcarbamoyladenylate synthase
MKTKMMKLDEENFETKNLAEAVRLLRSGEIVGFPTETVYGLGANAFNPEAVRKIFMAKGRPSDNPLIVHVCSIAQLNEIAIDVPKIAEKLINRFWPGPLTLILKKSENVPFDVTAGLDTIAVRMPYNKIAITLIGLCGFPIAAPSANLSGKPSSTKAEHVYVDFNGKIKMIIDGGICDIGVESTVLDLTSKNPVLLRPGSVTLEDLEKSLGKVELGFISDVGNVKSPGMKYKHYSPNAKLILIEGEKNKVIRKIFELKEKYSEDYGKIGEIYFDTGESNERIKFLGSNLYLATKNLFDTFRDFDNKKIGLILCAGVAEKGLGMALMNRLRKASSEIIVV